ncbi:ankyrin repeat domain-containing protein [Streptomyces sp. R302]|uniref:ankyrin repeat domain-containing protein n=1 Tax=unclassified Streptomyces TaxID=2593676 RepID=UPI00145F2903|nr:MULTISPECIES: ankyrin repeat domain-containing protein [unclassified Streptomyces]NML51748.1 ankyrin repeat domain-containing protein [Streptomyces sp. R301]NML81368.1 ankyrin repeat domain-containing protein [Streptomyces sp. R302]
MDDGTKLVAAVRQGDAAAVAGLLEAGADPDTVTEDGLPVLCAAIAAFDTVVAKALVEAGADQDRSLSDGTTPLVRAVDSGSPAVVAEVLGLEPRLRLTENERQRLLDVVGSWCERDAEDELRRRTGMSGPVQRVPAMDDEYHHAGQLTLGGLTVRDGHGAILTDLEWAFRVLTPVDDLVARAAKRRDPDHVDWAAVRGVLGERRSRETWSAVAAYRHSTRPERRRFVLDVAFGLLLAFGSWRNSYETEVTELVAAWAHQGDDDPDVLAEVLRVLDETECEERTAVGLRYAVHPDARVRARVPELLRSGATSPAPLDAAVRTALVALAGDEDWRVRVGAGRVLSAQYDGSAEVAEAVVRLLRDPEAQVRGGAAEAAAAGEDRTAELADALAALMDEDDFGVRLDVAYGLLRRDDPRTAEAIGRLGRTYDPAYWHDHRLSAVIRSGRAAGSTEE